MKLAILSDPHLGSQNPVFNPNWDRVVALVTARSDLALAVILGDLTLYGSELASDLPFGRAALDGLALPWLAVPGNHDVGDISRSSAQPANAERLARWAALVGAWHWQSDAIDGWRLIGLNSQIIGTGLPEEAAQWQALEAALASCGRRRAVIFLHMPLFLQHWDEADQPGWTLAPESRARLRRLIVAHRVAAVVSGHMHRAQVVDWPETRLIWCPASSFLSHDASLPPQSGAAILGTTILTLDETGVSAEFLAPEGLRVSRIEDYNGTIYPQSA